MGRRQSSKNLLTLQPKSSVELPWTASRCNRTLRQLSAFVSRLDKWHKEFKLRSDPQRHDHLNHEIKDSTISTETEVVTWLACPSTKNSKKKIKQYGSRKKIIPQTPGHQVCRKVGLSSNQGHDILSSPCQFETPQIRTLDPELSRDRIEAINCRSHLHPVVQTQNRKFGLHCRHKKEFPNFSFDQVHQTACRPGSYEKLVSDADTIIKSFFCATSDSEAALPAGTPNRKGAKNLFEMCQRKTAKIMIDEQLENDTVTNGYDGKIDVVGTTLQGLEEVFGNSDIGWKPLRTITRSYGINLLCQCISSGQIRLEVAQQLAKVSLQTTALSDFGEAAVEAMVELQITTAPSNSREDIFSCYMMPAFAAMASFPGDPHDSHGEELRNRTLQQAFSKNTNSPSLEWLLTIDGNCHYVEKLVNSIQDNCQMSASRLVETIYVSAMEFHKVEGFATSVREGHCILNIFNVDSNAINHWSKKLEKALQRGILRLIVVSIRYRNARSQRILDRLSQKSELFVELYGIENLSTQRQHLAMELIFANICSKVMCNQSISDNSFKTLQRLLQYAESPTRRLNELSCMLSNLARGYNLQTSTIALLTKNLASLQGVPGDLKLLLVSICVDASLEVSRKTRHPDHLTWASGLQQGLMEMLRSQSTSCGNSSLQTIAQGYRWNDVLEEWIAKTPAKKEFSSMVNGKALTCEVSAASTSVEHQIVLSRAGSVVPKPEMKREGLQKRKSRTDDFEEIWDGDFKYKRMRKCLQRSDSVEPLSKEQSSKRNSIRRSIALNEESEDELSIVD